MTVDSKTIGKRIKAHRILRKMTQAELAERLGLSDVYISYIETGSKKASLTVILKLANEFSISVDSLLYEDSPTLLPQTYCTFADLLADCNSEEQEDILKTAMEYKKSRRGKWRDTHNRE